MKISIGHPNKIYTNNYVSKVNFSFFNIPYVSINKYFIQNNENIYFLILSLLQLSTAPYIGLLPKKWSPTGPYSTFIPLLLCFLLELFSIIFNWICSKKYEISENYKKIRVFRNNTWKEAYSKDIYPGDIIYLPDDTIIPVDCLALFSDSTQNPKICLSSLNGEADLVPINLLSSKDYLKYLNKDLIIDKLYIDDLFRFNAHIDNTNINENFFLPGGAINLDNSFIALTIGCGKNKKCYNQAKCSKFSKKNSFDKINSDYMMDINAKILILKIIGVTLFSYYYENSLNLYIFSPSYFIQKIIQNWILFNGVIPFSIKILSILSRYIQSKL